MGIDVDYSMVILWAYFIAYILMFLVVSIICAISVHREKFPNSSIGTLLKAWVVSLWHKKKIYGELLPHFFDQATDFGVVYEFGIYYEKQKHGESFGINAAWLFYLSFTIIIAHRVISAVAVYNLTRKPMYAVYQFFDVLMIQCVYTNYKLGTTQPSNAQRYLQTMEAIFESAPQILISTAFLIKSTTTSPSPTVIASILTSLYSLSARVSADDKVMLKDEWKQPKHRNKEGKWVWPFINIKYMVRVFLWRFLEISSRITLLVLTWINLGGRSIIFILFIEFCYLSVLAWALGTIDIMGNLIYLMAANSKRKGYKWAIPMAKIFWVWRVLSAHALLITITAYAATDSQYGMDALDNEAGETRYQQTFVHPAGLLLFVYSWIATPLWQWVGAIVIFDFKNLASVGRDVDTLVEDGKWDQVLELVSFGAEFDAGKVLQKIQRQKAKEDAPQPEEKKEEMEAMMEGPNCPAKHGLNEFKAEADGFRCDICGLKKRKGDMMYGCRVCNYDVCAGCKEGVVRLVKCDAGHIMKHRPTTNTCSMCKRKNKSSDMVTWRCEPCQYNLCDKCYERKRDVKSLPPIDQLELMCEDQIAEDALAENDKCMKVRDVCEYVCSCPTFMALLALMLLGGGIWYAVNYGTQNDGFFLAVCPMLAAAILLFCAVSCFFDLFEKWGECLKETMQRKKIQREMSIAMGKINCPGKHGMTIYVTELDGLGCDLCKNKVNKGTKLYGCRLCNYDVCTICKPEPVEPVLPEAPKKRTEMDDIVMCPDKHMLIPRRRTQYKCGKCNVDYQRAKSWYCRKCEYHLCLKCFDAAQADIKAMLNLWMKDRKTTKKPILKFGGVGWLALIGLAFFLGSDIAALSVIGEYDCDIISGYHYTSFNVETFLEVGAIMHFSILGLLMCCGGAGFIFLSSYDQEKVAVAAAGCTGCFALFFVCWIVIGFLIHGEMTPGNVVDDTQCIPMVLSWTVIKLIELGMPVLAGCAVLLIENAEEAAIVSASGLAGLTVLAFFIGSDIAVLAIESKVNCDNAMIGNESIVSPSTFMNVGGILHLCVLVVAGCVSVGSRFNPVIIGGYTCCACIFFVIWCIMGLLMRGDMDSSTDTNKMCDDAVLSWCILTIIQIVGFACGGGLAVFG
eukprot:907200_1